MSDLFTSQVSPFSMSFNTYFRITGNSTAPITNLELKVVLRKLIAHAENIEHRLTAIEAVSSGGPGDTPASDGVREAAKTTLQPKTRRRDVDTPAG